MFTMLSSFIKSISNLAWVFVAYCIPLVYVHNIFHLLDLFLSIFEKVLAFPLISSAFSTVVTKIQETRRYLDELSSNMEKDTTNDLASSGFMDGIERFVWYILDTFLTSIYAIEIVKLFNFGLFRLDFLLGWFTFLPFVNPCREKLHVLMKYGETLETKLKNPMGEDGEDVTLTETGKRKFDQIKEALSNQESICKMFKAHKAPKEATETLELEDPKTEDVFEDHAVVSVFKPEVLQVTPEILSNLGLPASTNNEDIVNQKSNEDLIKTTSRNVAMASIGKISLKPIEEISEVIGDKIDISSTDAKNKADIVEVSNELDEALHEDTTGNSDVNIKPVVVMIESLAMDGTKAKDEVTFLEPIEECNQSEITKTDKGETEKTEEINKNDVDVVLEATQMGENIKPKEEMIESKVTEEIHKNDVDVLLEATQMGENMKPKEEIIESKVTEEVELVAENVSKPSETVAENVSKPSETEKTVEINKNDVDVVLEATQMGENKKPKEEMIESKVTEEVELVAENVSKPSPKMKLVGVVKPMVETSHDNIESSRTSDDMKSEAAQERAWVGLKKSYNDQKSNQNGAKTTENVVSNEEAAKEKIIPNSANASEYNSPKNGSASANFKKNGSSSDNFSPQSNQKNSPGYNMEASKLFVFGVDESVGEEDMAKEFSKFGEVANVYNTGKGYAFVTMSTPEQANAALEKLDGTQVFGKEIKVSIAVAKPAGGGRGRGQSPGQQRGRGRGQQRGRGRGGRGRSGYRGH